MCIHFSIDMDAQDSAGNTPLHATVEDDSFDAMDFLLSVYVESLKLQSLTHIK